MIFLGQHKNSIFDFFFQSLNVFIFFKKKTRNIAAVMHPWMPLNLRRGAPRSFVRGKQIMLLFLAHTPEILHRARRRGNFFFHTHVNKKKKQRKKHKHGDKSFTTAKKLKPLRKLQQHCIYGCVCVYCAALWGAQQKYIDRFIAAAATYMKMTSQRRNYKYIYKRRARTHYVQWIWRSRAHHIKK